MEENRIVTMGDEKAQIVDFQDSRFIPPDIGIYEGEIRYYKANKQWASFIEGHLLALASVAAWVEAQDESHIGIQAIRTFIEGITLEIQNCGDVEDCLSTSPTIIGLNDGISAVEEDVTGGTGSGFKPSSVTKTMQDSTKYPKFSGDLIEPTGGCNDADKDRLWGAIVKLVTYVHQQNYALLNSIAAATDLSGAYNKFADNVPLIAALNLLDSINLMDDILSNLATSYNSSVTEAFIYQVCADLFCAATACTFSIENFTDYVASNAGGSYDAAVSTLLDVGSSLIGQTTGGGIFYALSWFQMTALGLGEKFATAMNLDNLCLYVQSAKPDSQWQTYASACASHTGAWTLILTYSDDYVVVGSEYVYNMTKGRFTHVSGNDALLTQAYKKGLVYTEAGSGFVNKRLNVANAGAQFQDARIFWRRSAGPATAQITVLSNLYTPPANTTTNSTFFLDTFKPLRGVGSPVGSISYLQIQWGQQTSTQAVASELKYIEIRGTGELPKFT